MSPVCVSTVCSCHNCYDPAAIFSEIVLSLRDSSCDICHEQEVWQALTGCDDTIFGEVAYNHKQNGLLNVISPPEIG